MKTFGTDAQRGFPGRTNGKFGDKRSGRLILKTSKGLKVLFFFILYKNGKPDLT